MSDLQEARVWVNVDGQAFVSDEMAVDQAQQSAEEVKKAVVECGGAWWFVKFPAANGDVWIRGRDVIAIQLVPVQP